MALIIAVAFIAGMLITLSRQVNGRLAHETSALGSAFWNHVVGFGVLIALALATGQIWPQAVATTPFFAWLSGAFGVVFVASGSWVGCLKPKKSVAPCATPDGLRHSPKQTSSVPHFSHQPPVTPAASSIQISRKDAASARAMTLRQTQEAVILRDSSHVRAVHPISRAAATKSKKPHLT